MALPAPSVSIDSPPALVDLGGGDMALLAVGGDAALYRWRFEGLLVHPPERVASAFRVAATRFAADSVATPGDGLIDVALVETGGQVLYGRLPAAGAPPSEPFRGLGLGSRDRVVVTALSADRLHLLVRGQDHRLHGAWSDLRFTRLTGVAPPGERLRELTSGSSLPTVTASLRFAPFRALTHPDPRLTLGGVALLGEAELVAVATAGDHRLRLGRFSEGRWSAFTALPSQPNWAAGGQVATARAAITAR